MFLFLSPVHYWVKALTLKIVVYGGKKNLWKEIIFKLIHESVTL